MSSTATTNDRLPSKAHQWFTAGAQVLAQFEFELPAGEWYACPLCKTFFTIDELATKNLTKEHVPPRSVGGREMVLTCRQCNNSAGSTFDAQMERAEAFRRFGSDEPLRPLDITLTVGGIPNRGSMYSGPGVVLIFGNPKQNHPDDVARISESLGDLVNDGHPMHISFRETFHPRMAELGFVRSAYLAAFATFGYAYIFRTVFEPIRAVLNGADDGSLVLPVLLRAEGRAEDRHVGLISEPSWLAGAVLVVIGQTAIVLPNVDTPGDPLNELATRRDRSPEDLHRNITTSPAFEWPTGPRHSYDRWLIAQRG
jgi:HNH endonuclease